MKFSGKKNRHDRQKYFQLFSGPLSRIDEPPYPTKPLFCDLWGIADLYPTNLQFADLWGTVNLKGYDRGY